MFLERLFCVFLGAVLLNWLWLKALHNKTHNNYKQFSNLYIVIFVAFRFNLAAKVPDNRAIVKIGSDKRFKN